MARFNERFLLSLASCPSCLVVDDELNLLPMSSHNTTLAPLSDNTHMEDVEGRGVEHIMSESEKELIRIKKSLESVEISGPLVTETKTLDQARVVMQCLELLSVHSLKHVVAITASRGRGKSAALGLAVAAAIAHGYTNVFVTSPSPENLVTFFEFVIKGLGGLNLKYVIVSFVMTTGSI